MKQLSFSTGVKVLTEEELWREKSSKKGGLYDAIFIDEGQGFSEETARQIRQLLRNQEKSQLGIFYDERQQFYEQTFKNYFQIPYPVFCLRENIWNTWHIYQWTVEQTDLGKEVIQNPIEGAKPERTYFSGMKELNRGIERLLQQLVEQERVKNTSIVILADQLEGNQWDFEKQIASWSFTKQNPTTPNEIKISSVQQFKALEADVILYIHKENQDKRLNYIAYTRARYYLYELISIQG